MENSRMNQYCRIEADIAVGVIGGLGYYFFQNKKGQASTEVKDVSMPHNPPKQPLFSCGRHRKTGCYLSCIRDDWRVSRQTEDLTISHQCIKNGERRDVNSRCINKCTSFHR